MFRKCERMDFLTCWCGTRTGLLKEQLGLCLEKRSILKLHLEPTEGAVTRSLPPASHVFESSDRRGRLLSQQFVMHSEPFEQPVFFSWQTVPVNPTIGKFSTTNLNAFSACLYFFLSFFFFDEWVKWRKAFTVCCCVGVQICTRVDKYTWWFWEKSVHVFCH